MPIGVMSPKRRRPPPPSCGPFLPNCRTRFGSRCTKRLDLTNLARDTTSLPHAPTPRRANLEMTRFSSLPSVGIAAIQPPHAQVLADMLTSEEVSLSVLTSRPQGGGLKC